MENSRMEQKSSVLYYPELEVNVLLCDGKRNTKAYNMEFGNEMNDDVRANLETARSRGVTVYSDDRIALVENLKDASSSGPIRLDAFIAVLCLRGRASVYINGNLHELGINQLLVCHPNIMLEKSTVSMDFEFRTVCLSREYLQQMTVVGGTDPWDAINFFEKFPVLQLQPEEVKCFCQYYDLLRSKLQGTPHKHLKEVIDALLMAFLYEFRDFLERRGSFKPQAFTSADRVFRDFLKLLTTSYPKSRSVSFYADKLCLTPKYLSTVCKDCSGYTASELINRYVVKDIDYLLKKRDKSVKEICNELEFPNLSFFGRYVKKHLGLSPKQYRESIAGE